MPEIGMSVSMSGDGKRSVGHRPQATAPILDSTISTGDILTARRRFQSIADRDRFSSVENEPGCVKRVLSETSENCFLRRVPAMSVASTARFPSYDFETKIMLSESVPAFSHDQDPKRTPSFPELSVKFTSPSYRTVSG